MKNSEKTKVKTLITEGAVYFYIHDYHQDYKIPEHKGIYLRPVVDLDNVHDTIKFLGKLGKISPFREEAVCDSEYGALIQDLTGGVWSETEILAFPIEEYDMDVLSSGQIYRIDISEPEQILPWIMKWKKEILDEHPTGDDTFYDFYPGWVDMFVEACKCLSLESVAKDTIKQLYQRDIDENLEDGVDYKTSISLWVDELGVK